MMGRGKYAAWLAGLALVCAAGPSAARNADPQVSGGETASAADAPRDHLKFSSVLTADCMLHRARLRQIANTDPKRAIRVVLVNYTGRTRSQGTSEKILPPASGPQPLGCDGVRGLERRWEIVKAEYVDDTGSD